MNTELVKALLVEIDGNTEKLRRALREGGVELDKFGSKAKQSGQTSSTASDAVAGRQANAARAIAATTETISRQGKVTGETGKQLVAQAANAAFAFGPKGAIVGAIGISTLAIVGMFTRIKREAREAAAETAREFERMAALDLVGISREVSSLDTGDFRLRQQLASSDAAVRERALERFRQNRSSAGATGLAEERARQQAILTSASRGAGGATAAERTANRIARAQAVEEIKAIDEAAGKLRPLLNEARDLLAEGISREGERAGSQLAAWRRDAQAERDKDAAKERERLAHLSDGAREELYGEFQRRLVEGFNGTRAEIEQSFAEMIAFAEATGEQAEIPILRNARDRALELLDLTTRIDAALQSVEFDSLWDEVAATEDRGLDGPYAAQLQQLRLLRDEAIAFSNDERRTAKDREASMKTAVSLQGQISALLKETEPKQQEVTRSLADQAREVADMVDGVLQLAAAWGNVSDATINVLRGLTSMAGALPGLLDSFTALDKARKSGSGVGMAHLGVVGSALPIVGAIATIAGTLFGESPAERERKRVQQENTRALEDLTRQVGLFGIGLSGSDLASAGGDVSRILGGSQRLGRSEWMLQGGASWRGRVWSPELDAPLAGMSDRARVDWSRFSDVDRRALEDAAAAMGITLDGTVGSLRKLQAAIEEVNGKFGEFSDSFADRQTLADAQMDLLGIDNPAERLKLGTAVAQSMSPAIAKLFEGIDLQSAEDRTKLRDSLLEVLDKLQAGGDAFSAADFGDLTPDEFWQTVLQIISGLGAVDGSVSAGAAGTSMGGLSGFRGLTEAAGERLADYQRTLVGIGRDSLSVLQQQLAYLAKMAGTPLLAPPMPLGFGSGGGGSVSISMSFGDIHLGDVHLMLEPGTDPARAGEAALRVMGHSVEQVLYDALVRAKRAAGDLSIVGPLR